MNSGKNEKYPKSLEFAAFIDESLNRWDRMIQKTAYYANITATAASIYWKFIFVFVKNNIFKTK